MALTDEQWAKVVQHFALPPEARPHIEAAIASYRHWQRFIDARKTPAEIRAELDRLHKDTEALITGLVALMADSDKMFAFEYPLRPPKGWPSNTGPVPDEVARQRLKSAIYELRRLAIWLGLARDRVRRGKPGGKRRATPAYFLVNHLNEILERFTGKKITRSTKKPAAVEYVKTVCRIADPKIGNGTIIEAIRKEIKYYKPFGGIASNPTGVIPPPIQRDKRPTARKTAKRNRKEV